MKDLVQKVSKIGREEWVEERCVCGGGKKGRRGEKEGREGGG